jgi:hypothetical protein
LELRGFCVATGDHRISKTETLVANPFQWLSRMAGRAWGTRKGEAMPASGELLHDPAASRPHDLDDPFFDATVQRRVADVIAGAAMKKPHDGG